MRLLCAAVALLLAVASGAQTPISGFAQLSGNATPSLCTPLEVMPKRSAGRDWGEIVNRGVFNVVIVYTNSTPAVVTSGAQTTWPGVVILPGGAHAIFRTQQGKAWDGAVWAVMTNAGNTEIGWIEKPSINP